MTTRVDLRFGTTTWSVNCTTEQLLTPTPSAMPAPTATPGELVAASLDRPFGFEMMRQAVTPDDQVVIVVDHSLPDLPEMIAAIVAHLAPAGISPEAITLLSPPDSPALAIHGLRHEIHDPADSKKLAYLATTKSEKRIYLNRTLVESDFAIILSSRRYDLATGYAGGEAAIFPALSDTAARAEYQPPFRPDTFPKSSQRQEAVEIAWLLGTPFLIHVIEDEPGRVAAVACGLLDSSVEGLRLQDVRWKATVSERADVVIACVNRPPAEVTFADLAFAATVAARAVEPDGRIVIACQLPEDCPERELLQRFDEASDAVESLDKSMPNLAARIWSWVASRNKLVMTTDETELLFAIGIDNANDLQRLVSNASRLLIIPNAHRQLVSVES